MTDGAERAGDVAGERADVGAFGDAGDEGHAFLPGTGSGTSRRLEEGGLRMVRCRSGHYLGRGPLHRLRRSIDAFELPPAVRRSRPEDAVSRRSPFRGGF